MLLMGEFYAIISMDWMARYKSLIDYKNKKFQLCLKQNVKIAFQGIGSDRGSCLILF